MRLANSWLQAGLGALMAAGATCALLLSFAKVSGTSVPSPLYALAAIFLAGTVGAAVFAALWKRVDLASDALVVRRLVGETRVPVASLGAFAVWVETHHYGAVTRFTYVSALDGSRGALAWDGSDDLLILLDRLVPPVAERMDRALLEGEDVPWGQLRVSTRGVEGPSFGPVPLTSEFSLSVHGTICRLAFLGVEGWVTLADLPLSSWNFHAGAELLRMAVTRSGGRVALPWAMSPATY